MLDPVVPQYISDLISWSAIGARTTESQTHREMTSGLSMPVGFKNATSGNVQVALDAIQSAKNPHAFIGINQDGKTSLVRTSGNSDCHVVLRGGHSKPNYSKEHIDDIVALHEKANVLPSIMVDCSHANSNKKPEKQAIVLKEVIEQRKTNSGLIGLMIESNLKHGNQSLPKDLSKLEYGLSITDACIDWQETEELLEYLYTNINSF